MSRRIDIRKQAAELEFDFKDYPVVSKGDSALKQGLFILLVFKNEKGILTLTPAEIGKVAPIFRLKVTRQAVLQAFDKYRDLASLKGAGPRRIACKILPAGEDFLFGEEKRTCRLIPPGTRYPEFKRLKEFFKKTKSELKIIDPYTDENTLDLLAGIPKGRKVKIITSNTGNKTQTAAFKRACKRFESDRKGEFEIRVTRSKKLHDRYILKDGECWIIGTSLKDVGNKASTEIKVDELKTQVGSLFNSQWKTANSLI